MSIDPGVDIGHVHLRVSDIQRALDFYGGVLGFEEQVRYGDQAVFLSAGGYHHHIALNTWAGALSKSPFTLTHTGLQSYVVKFCRPFSEWL